MSHSIQVSRVLLASCMVVINELQVDAALRLWIGLIRNLCDIISNDYIFVRIVLKLELQ